MTPKVLMNDGIMTLATLGPVCIYLYVDTMNSSHIARGAQLHRAHHKQHPEGIGLLLIHRSTKYLSKDSDPRTLQDLIALARETGDYVKAAAIVVEEKGFTGAAIRAAGIGVTLIARPRFGVKYSSTVREGAEYLVQQLSAARSPTVDEMIAAVTEMERAPRSP